MPEPDVISLSPVAREKLRSLIEARQLLDIRLQEYLAGYIAGRNVKGQWGLDTNSWKLKRVKEDESPNVK